MIDDLLIRLRQRIAEGRANDSIASTATGAIELGGLAIRRVSLGDAQAEGSNAAPAGSRATEADLEELERRLGGALPEDVRRLYAEVANGAFGPGDGLLSTEQIAKIYDAYRRESQSRGGQEWPANLVPLKRWDVGCDCVDLNTGAIVHWDEEQLAAGGSDAIWQRSFKVRYPDVEGWLGEWLDMPRAQEEAEKAMQPHPASLIHQDNMADMTQEEVDAYFNKLMEE